MVVELEDLADLKAIHESIDELKNNDVIKLILEENKKLKEHVHNIEEENKKLEDDLVDIELMVVKQDRYSRRNNIEIGGIPEHFNDEQLEEVSLSILNKLEVKWKDVDLSTIHGVFKNVKLSINNDNLCPYDVSLLGMCRHLFSKKKINSCFWEGKYLY